MCTTTKFLCDLDKIQVGGDTAKTAQETCCDSFQERKEGSYMNAAVSDRLLLIFVVLTVRQQNVCIMRIVSVMQERSVWKAVMPVIVKAQSDATFQCR